MRAALTSSEPVHLAASSEAAIVFGGHLEFRCATPLFLGPFGIPVWNSVVFGAIWNSGAQPLVFWGHLEWPQRTSAVGPVQLYRPDTTVRRGYAFLGILHRRATIAPHGLLRAVPPPPPPLHPPARPPFLPSTVPSWLPSASRHRPPVLVCVGAAGCTRCA